MRTSTKHVCHSCGSEDMSMFYKVNEVPVHSCLMLATQEAAFEYPKGDIDLGFCKNCGFISNVLFDPKVHEYSPRYEDQQCFSPTFNAFAQELAHRLIERYDLNGKNIVEIGCGKGDFLILLCDLGGNCGIGIDPSCDAERLLNKVADRVTFVQDFYSERYAHYQPDFICCRHTLEHIQPTAEFVGRIRGSIGNRLDTVVFFELPDVTRVLRDLAFWDIYYEHCSYFSLGSLARLFRFCRFDVLDLTKDYDDQYLLIDTLPANGVSTSKFKQENDLQKLTEGVTYFAENVQSKLDWWKQYIQENKKRNKSIVIWGSGSKCVAFLTTLKIIDAIDFVVDINPYRHWKYIPGAGKKIMPPEFLKEYQPDIVVVMNPIYLDEIQHMLNKMEVSAEVISI